MWCFQKANLTFRGFLWVKDKDLPWTRGPISGSCEYLSPGPPVPFPQSCWAYFLGSPAPSYHRPLAHAAFSPCSHPTPPPCLIKASPPTGLCSGSTSLGKHPGLPKRSGAPVSSPHPSSPPPPFSTGQMHIHCWVAAWSLSVFSADSKLHRCRAISFLFSIVYPGDQ